MYCACVSAHVPVRLRPALLIIQRAMYKVTDVLTSAGMQRRLSMGQASPALRRLVLYLIAKSVIDVALVGFLAVGFYYKAFTPYIIGQLDEAGPEWIRGWVINQALPQSHVEVQLYIDGRFAESRQADFPHPSLVTKGLSEDERHGFLFFTPPLAPGEHEARAYAVHESGGGARRTLQLLGKPIRFKVDDVLAEPYFRGWLDVADQGKVQGWVVNQDQPSERVEVHLYIDGRFVEARSADQPRPDLFAAGLVQDERHGFFFFTPPLVPGEHEARVYAVHQKGVEGGRTLRLIRRPVRFNVGPSAP